MLGAVMLSEDAANEVMDRLGPEDFYIPAHQAVFESIVTLYNGNEPIDAITVSDLLRRKEELDRIGGVGFITRLMDAVPTASNVGYYAEIVEEHSLRRSLLQAGAVIGDLATRTDQEIEDVVDEAERTVLGVAEKRVGDGLLSLAGLINPELEKIEALEGRGTTITGLATGFRDLDKELAGLQPANLVVIAARPGMGKCLHGDTLIVDPKTGARVPIKDLVETDLNEGQAHVLSLDEDMRLVQAAPIAARASGVQEVLKVTTRLGHEIVASGNHPFLTVAGWKRLEDLRTGNHLAVARTLGVFGVDRRSDAEVALVAYLIGDGNLTNTTPRLTAADPAIVEDAARWADQMGLEMRQSGQSISYSIRVPAGPTLEQVANAAGVSVGTVSLVVSGDPRPAQATREAVWDQIDRLGYVPKRARKSNTLTEVLEESGLVGLTSHEKFVPEWVFRLPQDQLALFLNRLFATDGSAWTSAGSYRIEYVTVSRRLAEDVQHLLRRFGVVAKLRTRSVRYDNERRTTYEVGFQDPVSVALFCTWIGIYSKEPAVGRVRAASSTRRVQRFADLVPSAVLDTADRERQQVGWSWAELERRAGSRIKKGQRISRDRLRRVADALGSTELRNLAESDVVWDEVVTIEPLGASPTFDLQIPVHENFVANDFVVHNSALATNIAANVALHGGTVAIFSLEMGAEEVVQRFLCSIGRVDSMKLRAGQLSPEQWQKVVHAASRLYEANIYVDDSSNVMMTDIRAKARRLKRSRGLDLIVVDYLQLMQGRNRENRQQEIAEISRNLKNLARELHIPIIAISQLNRALEQREDKRPRLGDLRECLVAETPVRRADTGATVTIGEIARAGLTDIPVWSLGLDGSLTASVMKQAWSTGVKPTFKLTTRSGRTIRATGNHPLMTLQGWLPLASLSKGDRIAVPRNLPSPQDPSSMTDDEVVLLAHLIGDGSYVERQPLRYTSDDPANHQVVIDAAVRAFGVIPKKQDLPDRSWQTRLSAPYRLARGRRNPVCAWLDELGIYGQRSKEKRIPDVVFGLPVEQVRLFLRHLWATDGSMTVRRQGNRATIYYATSSRGLAEDVNALLLRLDFQPRIRTVDQGSYSDSYHVALSGVEQQRRFVIEVGCHGRRGEVASALLAALDGKRSNTNVDTIPQQVWNDVRVSMKAVGVTHRQLAAHLDMQYCGTAMFRPAPSRERLARVGGLLQDERLLTLASNDVLWDEIASIEPAGQEETFDAVVPGTHNFLAGDIVVHNSGAIEQDSDVVMFIYRDEYYNPETSEYRGMAEVNIAKHRAGATGRVQMTFLPEFTLFADLGRDVAP